MTIRKFTTENMNADIFADIMYLLKDARQRYMCNRPPRASGALIINTAEAAIRAGVYAPAGPSCDELGCDIHEGHCVRCVHAEQAAIANAAKVGLRLDGGTIYSINKPCHNCTKLIIAAGLLRIVYLYAVYDEERTNTILEAAGVEVVHISDDVLCLYADTISNGTVSNVSGTHISWEDVNVLLESLEEGLNA